MDFTIETCLWGMYAICNLIIYVCTMVDVACNRFINNMNEAIKILVNGDTIKLKHIIAVVIFPSIILTLITFWIIKKCDYIIHPIKNFLNKEVMTISKLRRILRMK